MKYFQANNTIQASIHPNRVRFWSPTFCCETLSSARRSVECTTNRSGKNGRYGTRGAELKHNNFDWNIILPFPFCSRNDPMFLSKLSFAYEWSIRLTYKLCSCNAYVGLKLVEATRLKIRATMIPWSEGSLLVSKIWMVPVKGRGDPDPLHRRWWIFRMLGPSRREM